MLNDLDRNGVDAVAAEITAAGGTAVTCAGDIGEWSTAEALLAAALREFGRLDILVNNAGVLRDRMIFSMSPEEWDLVLRTHLRGHFLTSRVATAYWREASKQAGGEVYARIINTSSEAFLLGSSGPAQLRRGQGRDHGADADDRAQLRPLRRPRERDLPAGADRDDWAT